MTVKKLETLGLVLLVCLFCFSLFAQRQAMADDSITSNVKITPKKKLSDAEHRALSEAAGRLLSHVNLARQAIADNKLDAAKEQVDKALTLVKIIQNAAPTYEIDANIKSGDSTYSDKRTVEQLIVPIYAEMDQAESVLLPIKQAKKESAAQAAAKNGSAPVDVDFIFTKASLDVGGAKLDLKKAVEALDNKDGELANKSLADIQNRLVIFEYDEWDTPMVRARSYLWDALKSVENKDWSDAKTYVKEAGENLRSLKDKGSKELSEKVKALSGQFSDLNKKLDEKKDSAKTDILSLWDKITKGM
jgi:YfdX protein